MTLLNRFIPFNQQHNQPVKTDSWKKVDSFEQILSSDSTKYFPRIVWDESFHSINNRLIQLSLIPEPMTLFSRFYTVIQQQTHPVKTDSWTNDSFKLIISSDSIKYSTSKVWFLNQWLFLTDSIHWFNYVFNQLRLVLELMTHLSQFYPVIQPQTHLVNLDSWTNDSFEQILSIPSTTYSTSKEWFLKQWLF